MQIERCRDTDTFVSTTVVRLCQLICENALNKRQTAGGEREREILLERDIEREREIVTVRVR